MSNLLLGKYLTCNCNAILGKDGGKIWKKCNNFQDNFAQICKIDLSCNSCLGLVRIKYLFPQGLK